MRYSNLEVVNKCLISMNDDTVTVIAGNERAEDILNVIEDVYYDLTSRINHPYNNRLEQVFSSNDPTRPTEFLLYNTGTNLVKCINKLDYNIADNPVTEYDFRELDYYPADEFLRRVGQYNSDVDLVTTPGIGRHQVLNNEHPTFYSDLRPDRFYLNAYLSSEGTFTNDSRLRALVERIPTFQKNTDGDIQDMKIEYFPVWLRESQDMCHAIFKDGVNPKIASVARRNRVLTQNDRFSHGKELQRPRYGRH